jgi:hypothetical protein
LRIVPNVPTRNSTPVAWQKELLSEESCIQGEWPEFLTADLNVSKTSVFDTG